MSIMSKRAVPPRAVDYSSVFLKDWERLNRSGRYNMRQLKEVMLLLIANDEPLGSEWRDHRLQGEMSLYRECHIGGDFPLMYRIDGHFIYFHRVGTHSDLFK